MRTRASAPRARASCSSFGSPASDAANVPEHPARGKSYLWRSAVRSCKSAAHEAGVRCAARFRRAAERVIERVRGDDRVDVAECVGAETRPAVIGGLGDDPGANRVQLDVAHASKEVAPCVHLTYLQRCIPDCVVVSIPLHNMALILPADGTHEVGAAV